MYPRRRFRVGDCGFGEEARRENGGQTKSKALGPIRCRHVDGKCPREPGGVETTAEKGEGRRHQAHQRKPGEADVRGA